jgi:hypothetical protein
VAASNATSRPSAVGTNTVPSATAAGSLIAAPTGVDQSMAPVAGSTAYIVPAFVPTYSASPNPRSTVSRSAPWLDVSECVELAV